MVWVVIGVGCTTKITGPDENKIISSVDKIIISNMIDEEQLFLSDIQMLNDSDTSLAKENVSLNVVQWGRWIESFKRTKNFELLNDTIVKVTILTQWSGKIWIRFLTEDQGVSALYKNFSEQSVHKVRFVKIDSAIIPRNRWRMKEVSGLQGGTTNVQGIAIQKIEFFKTNDTIIVIDPLMTFFVVGGEKHLQLGAMLPIDRSLYKIKVTVLSDEPDSDIVVIHNQIISGNYRLYARAPLKLINSTDNGNGTYTKIYEHSLLGAFPGRYFLMIDAIPRNAICDSSTAFGSQIWGVPFITH